MSLETGPEGKQGQNKERLHAGNCIVKNTKIWGKSRGRKWTKKTRCVRIHSIIM